MAEIVIVQPSELAAVTTAVDSAVIPIETAAGVKKITIGNLRTLLSVGGAGATVVFVGSGSPEGVVEAAKGLYWDYTNKVLYIKDTDGEETTSTDWREIIA